jgi:dynein heavy chain 2
MISQLRTLRKVHLSLVDMVVELMNVDLLRNKNAWKENLEKIRKIIDSATRDKDPRACKIWRTHWDYQLYKALEHQYQMGLELLNENLPEITADLVYKNKCLQFKPPLEELKARYYKEMSSFLTTPLRFGGVGGNTAIYKLMPDRNAKHLTTVFQKGEVRIRSFPRNEN